MATPAQPSAQAQDTDERALRKVFSKLVQGMKANDVIDELYEGNLLRREEYEGILDACSKEDSKTLNRRVLMAISRRPPGFAAKLAEILRKKHSYLADALEEALAEVNHQPRTDPAPTPDPSKDVPPSSSGSTVTSGPMSKWNVDALVALKGKLKLNVKMIALANILETPAGGFMNSAEAQSVKAKTGDAQQIEEVIDILRGRGDEEFATFCQMLRQCNYQVWARQLELKAEKFRSDGPMSKWNVDALVALKGKLKLNVKMIALANILETPAGGFMNSAEVQSVKAKTGDAQQIEEVIDILRGRGDEEFATFCQMLQKSNYQVWARQLELKAEKLRSDALPGTDPAPLRGNPQAVMSTSAPTPGPSKEGGVPSQSANITTHPLSPTLNNMCWPEFPAFQDEFTTIVSKVSETIHKLEQPQFDSLLVYLRERLRPVVDGCFPIEASPNFPNGPTPSELVQHLQDCHYWNYLNTDLLEGIIRHVSGEGSHLASLMTKYKKNICSKVTRTLKECKRKKVKPEPPPHYTTIAVEINTGGNPLSFHLYQILQLKDLLVQKFGVRQTLFAGFSVDVGYQQMSLFHKSWPSQVRSLEEEVAQLKQQLKKFEVDREELSAELRECRKIKVEPGVLVKEPLGSMKPRLKEERDEGEEPDCKKVKTEEADTVEVKHESHPQVPPQVGVFPPHVSSGARPPFPQPSPFQQPVQMGPPGSQRTQEPLGSMKPRLEEERDEGEEPDRKKVKTEEAETVEVKLESHPQVPPQGGVLPPHVFSGARPLEMEAEKFKTSDALPGTDPAPLRGNPQAVMSTSAPTPGPSKEGGVPPQQSANITTHPPLPTLNNMCWPEFPAFQDEFTTLVSKVSETIHKLEQPQFDSLLVYLRERLRPMVAGCFPTEGSPNLPKGITASELVQHLQDCHYWDYLNTNLLEGIIRHVSGEGSHLASLMTKYKKNICSKVTRTLKECKRKNVKPEPPPHYTTIAVEIDPEGNPLSFHLYQILQLKHLLVQKFGVRQTLFAGFSVDDGYQEMSLLHKVFVKEPLGSMKPRLKDERDEGEEPDRKKVKTEEADTVEVKLESHPQVPPQGGVLPPHAFSGARPPFPQPSSFQQPVLMGPPGSQRTQVMETGPLPLASDLAQGTELSVLSPTCSGPSLSPKTPASSSQSTLHQTADVIRTLDGKLDAKWRKFGTFLHVEPDVMDRIERDRSDVEDCMLQLVENWVCNRDRTGELPRTWQTVVQAVKDMKVPLPPQLEEQYGHC